jgi:hypothetical protein
MLSVVFLFVLVSVIMLSVVLLNVVTPLTNNLCRKRDNDTKITNILPLGMCYLECRSSPSLARAQELGLRSQGSGARAQEPGLRSQGSGARAQEPGLRS